MVPQLVAALLLAALLAAPPANARPRFSIPLSGPAVAIDGDTLDIDGQRVRLHGVDAPERRQTCSDRSGTAWPCGQVATATLAAAIGTEELICSGSRHDRYRRLIAVCWNSRADLGQLMVQQGLALAYRRYSTDYVIDEEAAHRAGLGIWAGDFVPPYEWRQRRNSRVADPG